MTVSVKKVLNSELAINSSHGKLLFDALKNTTSLDNLVLSFKGMDLVSSAFLNESIGKLALLYPDRIGKINFLYPKKDFILHDKVQDVIENALLGEKYDHMVDDAISSL